LFFGLRMVPDVRCESQPQQGALCCLISMRLLLFLNRKTEKPKTVSRSVGLFTKLLPLGMKFILFRTRRPKPPPQRGEPEEGREVGGYSPRSTQPLASQHRAAANHGAYLEKPPILFLLFECLSPPTALCPFHTPALFRPGPLT
jgi:hypothetical protein